MSININYEEAFIQFLQNNYFTNLPDQNIIDSNREIAKAVWSKHYISSNDYENRITFVEWYKKAKINEVLKNYGNDIEFWEENFKKSLLDYKYSSENPYNLLLDEQFQSDFPIVTNYFLHDDNQLSYLFEVTKNRKFLELSTLTEMQQDELFKNNILSQYNQHYTDDDIKKFQNDDNFILELLKKNIHCYKELSADNEHYQKYTDYVATIYAGYKLLSPENKEKYFDKFLVANIYQIDIKYLSQFTASQKEKVLKQRLDLTLCLMESNKFVGDIDIYWLENNVNAFISAATEKNILQVVIKPKIFDNIMPQLEEYIKNYHTVKESGFDKKMILFIQKNENLLHLLKENNFYKLNAKLNLIEKDNVKQNSEWFNSISKELLEDYNLGKFSNEETYEYIIRMKKSLCVESHKELKLPSKNLIDVLSKKYLYERLQEEIPQTNLINKKIKI